MNDKLTSEEIIFVEANKPLLKYIHRLFGIYSILSDSEVRYVFLGALISADNNTTKEEVESNLKNVIFIKDNLSLLQFPEELTKSINKFVDKALFILNNNLKIFNK